MNATAYDQRTNNLYTKKTLAIMLCYHEEVPYLKPIIIDIRNKLHQLLYLVLTKEKRNLIQQEVYNLYAKTMPIMRGLDIINHAKIGNSGVTKYDITYLAKTSGTSS